MVSKLFKLEIPSNERGNDGQEGADGKDFVREKNSNQDQIKKTFWKQSGFVLPSQASSVK